MLLGMVKFLEGENCVTYSVFSPEFFSEYGSKHMAKRLRASCDD